MPLYLLLYVWRPFIVVGFVAALVGFPPPLLGFRHLLFQGLSRFSEDLLIEGGRVEIQQISG